MDAGSREQLKAVIYRGPAASRGCPEAIGQLLQSSPYSFRVVYAGPNEKVDISAETLEDAAVYAQPGGGDLDDAWPHMKRHSKIVKDYVSRGGRYLGICLGAYLAGHTPGFGLLPSGGDTDSETSQHKSQVRHDDDTVIQVDWHFRNGSTQRKRWMYFQDGAMIKLPRLGNCIVLGLYSSSQDVAACVTPYGKGWVGIVGPHPEADKEWYDDEDFKNPDGVKFDIGNDFISALMESR